jgi:CRISPR system Cascade subunit CasE
MSLYLLHTQPDPQRLAAWATRRGLLAAQGDFGYALHGLLTAAFGDQTPRPFRYLDAQEGLLAYTPRAGDDLLRQAALAPEDVATALGLGATAHQPGLRVREFPTHWPVGHVLDFEVRVRPVIREAKTGHERDAFLAAVEKKSAADTPLHDTGGEEVYIQWLRDQFARQGGAELLAARLASFRLLPVLRQTQPAGEGEARRKRPVGGPDAVLAGSLRVTDAPVFAQWLARGVGRHRAFGFGLLLLRPAGR